MSPRCSPRRGRRCPRTAASSKALEGQLAEARLELREFAHGVHPAALADGGLVPALRVLAERSPIPVDVRGDVPRLSDPVEAALFFVCSEALTNAAKHADASRVSVELGGDGDGVVLTIADDGRGGADPSRGSGLRGLADRVEALGGSLRLESPARARARSSSRVPFAGVGRPLRVTRPTGETPARHATRCRPVSDRSNCILRLKRLHVSRYSFV